MTRGSCHLVVDKRPSIPLVGGDFVFLAAPETYTLMSGPKERVRSVLEFVSPEEFHRSRLITYDGSGSPTITSRGGGWFGWRPCCAGTSP